MKILREGLDLDVFFRELSTARGRVLMLDYDGTLAPFRVERDMAVPYPGIPRILESIIAAGACRTVIISGRAIADLMPLMRLAKPPEIWGCHGWERRGADGTYEPPKLPEGLALGLAEAADWAEDAGLALRLERKPVTVALHWRGMREAEVAKLSRRVNDCWGQVARSRGLELLEFNGGLELRPPGRDKGFAVKTILGEAGEGAKAAYLGDDLTDEDAFRVLAGRGLGVLVNEEFRRTAADVWIRPPEELVDFLRRWSEAVGGMDD